MEPVAAAPMPRSGARTRTLALLALALTATVIAWLASTAYHAVSDSFVAPAILSPDSDVVLANKLRFSELAVERARVVAELESLEVDRTAAEQAVGRLEGLREKAGQVRRWVARLTSIRASAGVADLKTLADQRRVLEGMRDRQRELARRAQAELDGGLVSRADYAREALALTQLEVALLETDRALAQSQSTQEETQLAQRALARSAEAPPMPELINREESLVRLELEILRLQSERRSKLAQSRALDERLAKIDELTAQLRSRPAFRAMEQSLDVAFVPYTQLDGVEPGARVLSCLWGLLFCTEVGTVAELVPGEVVLPDPWGTQARGRYAVLALTDRAAAMAKVLRVRPGVAPRARPNAEPAASGPSTSLSVR